MREWFLGLHVGPGIVTLSFYVVLCVVSAITLFLLAEVLYAQAQDWLQEPDCDD